MTYDFSWIDVPTSAATPNITTSIVIYTPTPSPDITTSIRIYTPASNLDIITSITNIRIHAPTPTPTTIPSAKLIFTVLFS